MSEHYIPLLCLLIVSGGLVFAILTIPKIIAPRHPTPLKQVPYECGNFPIGDAYRRFNPHFYLLAVIFILFEVEIAFLAPWAAMFRELSWRGLVEVGVFVAVLLVGLAYAWRKGDLEWE